MLHNPSYDFNDELIPLGRHRLGAPGRGLAGDAAPGSSTLPGDERRPPLLAELRRGARPLPRGRRSGGPRRRIAPAPDARARRRDAGDGRGARRAARCGRAARHQQRLPRRRGLLRLGRAAARCSPIRPGRRRRGAPASPCSTCTRLNPYGFSWWRRTTHENVDLNRNFRDFHAGRRATPPTTSWPRLLVPPTWPPSDAVKAALDRFVAERGERALQQAISGGQYHHPQGLFYGGSGPTWSQVRSAMCCTTTARRCNRLGWIDLHTGPRPERPRRAHLRRPRRRRQRSRAHGAGGATSPRSTTARRPPRC